MVFYWPGDVFMKMENCSHINWIISHLSVSDSQTVLRLILIHNYIQLMHLTIGTNFIPWSKLMHIHFPEDITETLKIGHVLNWKQAKKEKKKHQVTCNINYEIGNL